jgi:DNA-binding response OmpR family regulator
VTQYAPTSDPRLCPTCGQALQQDNGMSFRIDGHFVLNNGLKVKISPMERKILKEIRRGMTMKYDVTIDHLISSMYEGKEPPKTVRNGVAVYINNLRRKLKKVGIFLTNEYKHYRLSFGEPR